jgi:selenide,water dikinase
LTQILTGALEALSAANVRLVGGHTSEGPQMGVGFSVTGFRQNAPSPIDGEHLLVLSKPLGSGLVMAGHMELVATGKAVADAIHYMEQSNAAAAQIFNVASGGAGWMTDVTGFGLARHAQNLIERAGFNGVEINISNLPLLDGVEQMLAAGIRSSLFDQNRAAVRCDDGHLSAPHRQKASVIFDPQTSGGMLALISPQKAHDVVKTLENSGYRAAIVGRASPHLTGLSLIDGGMQ